MRNIAIERPSWWRRQRMFRSMREGQERFGVVPTTCFVLSPPRERLADDWSPSHFPSFIETDTNTQAPGAEGSYDL